jgi:hypothetical protein
MLEQKLQALKDLQVAYREGYTIFNRTSFIDDSAIERDPSIVGTFTAAGYDPKLQAMSLSTLSGRDVLHTASGQIIVDPQIDVQVGYPDKNFSQLRGPSYALDGSDTSYWGETVLTSEPITMQWPTSDSVYNNQVVPTINSGAVCEYTITFREATNLNMIVIKPFSDLPLNLAGVFVVKKLTTGSNTGEHYLNTSTEGYGRYMISEFNSKRSGGMLFLDQTTRLFFPLQEECLSLTLVFNQPNYTRQVYSLSADTIVQNALWQQMLSNSPAAQLPTTNALDLTNASTVISSLQDSTGAMTDSRLLNIVQYQYVYGAYEISVYDRRYDTISTFVSMPLQTTRNLMQGALIVDDDLPYFNTTIASSANWIGNAPIPGSWQIPGATLEYSLTFDDAEPWYPLAPIGKGLVHEHFAITEETSSLDLRLIARPGTAIYLTSFDGQGNAILLGGVTAPTDDNDPTIVTWPNTILAAPGFYIVSYTPVDNSHWVDFGAVAEAQASVKKENFQFTGADLAATRALALSSYPYTNVNKIPVGYNPNGNPNRDYVPINVSITGLPIQFPTLVDGSGHPITLSSFNQDTSKQQNIYQPVLVSMETLYSQDNSQAGTVFSSANKNWVTDSSHAPQLFAIGAGLDPQAIPQYDQTGNSIWEYDSSSGIVTMLNANTAASGQIALTYWYKGIANPLIINKTNYDGTSNSSLVPFDATTYPFIEYVSIEDQLYFNIDLPDSAKIHVAYDRLFDTVRVKADFRRIDPINQSATPHLYGYTLVARDANGTSTLNNVYPEVSWGDLEVYSLGVTSQTNPGLSLVLGEQSVSNALPASTTFHWYRVVNAGPVADIIRTNYDASNGTTTFWDMNADRYIESDGGSTREENYRIMNVDGSNFIPVDPGGSIIIGICNFLLPPGQTGAIHPVTIYSSFTSNYLQSTNWLQAATVVTKEQSIASVVLN